MLYILISSLTKLIEDYSFTCYWPKGNLSIANSMLKFSQFTNVSLNFGVMDLQSCAVQFYLM